jgi:hypothetical protein
MWRDRLLGAIASTTITTVAGATITTAGPWVVIVSTTTISYVFRR